MSAGVPARAAYSPPTSEHPDAGSLVRRRYAARHPRPEARLGQVVTHLEHLREVAAANVLRVLGEAEVVARELQAARGPSLATIEQGDGRAGAPVPR